MASRPAASAEPGSATPFQRSPGATGSAGSAGLGGGFRPVRLLGSATTFSVAGRTGSRAE